MSHSIKIKVVQSVVRTYPCRCEIHNPYTREAQLIVMLSRAASEAWGAYQTEGVSVEFQREAREKMLSEIRDYMTRADIRSCEIYAKQRSEDFSWKVWDLEIVSEHPVDVLESFRNSGNNEPDSLDGWRKRFSED